jgi:hypothetical protein
LLTFALDPFFQSAVEHLEELVQGKILAWQFLPEYLERIEFL